MCLVDQAGSKMVTLEKMQMSHRHFYCRWKARIAPLFGSSNRTSMCCHLPAAVAPGFLFDIMWGATIVGSGTMTNRVCTISVASTSSNELARPIEG